jgi:selenocysteine lyase/cysteine desulfurase
VNRTNLIYVLVFGGSTTQLFHNLSSALFEHFHEGDEFVLSEIEHEANLASWVRLAERLKLTVKWWRGEDNAGNNPVLTAESLKPLLTPKTKFVACTHTSNILGTIHDISSIAKVVHDTCPGALVCIDSVAYAPHAPIDVQALGIDFLSFSWYKVYGPHIALLYCSPAGQKALTNLAHYFNRDPPERQNMENKLGLAAYNYEITQSIPRVVEYLSRPGIWDEIEKHEEKLQTTILDWLKKDERITVYGDVTGDRKKRVPVISFAVRGHSSRGVVEAVDKRSQYGVRWGHFYSHRLITKVFGLTEEGIIRISLVHYNTGKFKLSLDL